jgi:effector-binding domain-containing protein
VDYQIELRAVEAQPTAVVRRRANCNELSRVVPQGCGEVWAYFRSAGLPKPGRNLAYYPGTAGDVECGAEVDGPFPGNSAVVCSSTPAGLVATTAHWGPYDRLGEAHEAVRRWCADHGHALCGESWELYGHWDDDPAKLRTDVFYLLRPAGG